MQLCVYCEVRPRTGKSLYCSDSCRAKASHARRYVRKVQRHPANIEVMGHAQHSAVSAKQHWYLKAHDIKLEAEFNAYLEEPSRAEPSLTPVFRERGI